MGERKYLRRSQMMREKKPLYVYVDVRIRVYLFI